MTISAALLLAVLCSGYCFVSTFLPTKYRSAREAGHRLYFRVTLYAVLMAFAVSLLAFTINPPPSPSEVTVIDKVFDFPGRYMGFIEGPANRVIALLTLPFAFVLSHLLNSIYRWKKLHDRLLARVVKSRDFEKLVLYALNSKKRLLITLDTGEVYLGHVLRALDPTEPREHLRILPVAGGYKDPETHEIPFTTDYREAVNKAVKEVRKHGFLPLMPDDFEVIFPSDRIVSSRIFDVHSYGESADRRQ